MAKRVSIAVCLTLTTAFFIGSGCSSIPDHRKTLSEGSPDAGETFPDGGLGASGFTSSGGAGNGTGGTSGSGAAAGSSGAAGKGSGGKGGSGATGSGGRMGSGGSGNGGQTTSVDGGPDGGVVGIPCGTNHCPDRVVGRTTYPACCAGPNQDRCGVDTTVDNGPGCVEPNQAGVLDSVCIDMENADQTASYYGCCRPDGKCGVEFEWIGGPHFGCIDPTELGLDAGKDCTPAMCTAAGKACKAASECCPGPAGDPVCATFKATTGSVCTDYCLWNRDCPSGCCISLINGKGACAPDATSCSATCRQADETCDSDADCCSPNVCAPNGDVGPRLCRPKCTTDALCSPEYCVKDEAGRGACTTAHAGLCADSCTKAKDGVCDDGGDINAGTECALGTDCDDCGPRVGGTSFCLDSCSTHGNKKCEDGGPGAAAGTCSFGTDCSDCGPRLGLCSDACGDAKDGQCDDGGPGAQFSGCALGSDCTDCGVRVGARDQKVNTQELCDGSQGNLCVPEGRSGYIGDGNCDCSACAWDAVDCKVTATKCNGVALGACCAPGNPCHLPFDDGVCVCGGWCDWEQPDCGNTFPPPLCDFFSDTTGCDLKDPDPTFKNNGKCDCFGTCSWENAECKTVLGNRICTDTCKSADDDTCDDTTTCAWGTDCADCGPRFPKTP